MPREKNLEENLLYAHKHMSYVSLLLALSHFPAVYEGYQKPVLTVVLSGRMRDNRHKMKKGKFKLDVRKHFFIMRTAKHWSRLTREVVQGLSSEAFEARVNKALSNLI